MRDDRPIFSCISFESAFQLRATLFNCHECPANGGLVDPLEEILIGDSFRSIAYEVIRDDEGMKPFR